MYKTGDLVYACLKSEFSGLLIFPGEVGIVLGKSGLHTKVLWHGKVEPTGCLPEELIKVDDPQVSAKSTRFWDVQTPKPIEELRYNPLRV